MTPAERKEKSGQLHIYNEGGGQKTTSRDNGDIYFCYLTISSYSTTTGQSCVEGLAYS